VRLYPQKLINIEAPKGWPWRENAVIAAAIAETEKRLAGEGGQGGQGRVLLRASGTEPLLRVMVEGQDAARVEAEAKALAALVRETVQGAAIHDKAAAGLSNGN
jgi:phosphoglucosamine mutase